MDVTLALLCDAANYSAEGKLNILGAFNQLTAQNFPTVHPMMQLVIGLSASPAEAGTERELTIRVLNEDGSIMGEIGAQLTVPPAPQPGRRVGIQFIQPLPNTIYPEPGEYALHVLLGQDEKAMIPLTVLRSEPDTERQ